MINLKKEFDWTVIGAGPSGIAAVGKLLDAGIPQETICWIDPHFQVGDLGKKWNAVSSNTQVQLFSRFLLDCKAFSYSTCQKKFPIDSMDPEDTCLLQFIEEPLLWVTSHLQRRVHTIQGSALSLNLLNREWQIKTENSTCFSKNVILAIGCDEKSLNHPGKKEIPLEVALNPEKLQKEITEEDTVAVFGSSHSAILILDNCIKSKANKVINFYRSPLKYAIYLQDWILFDNTGLKGFASTWAKENLDGTLPKKLQRMLTSDHTFEESFSSCNKVIYAVGFERRKTPVLEQFESTRYNDKTGIIAPGLFGLGIAFPEASYDPLMNLEHRVGLWKFMDYLNKILPIWMKYST